MFVMQGDVEAAPTVHALWHGFALCRFTNDVPGLWPEGHYWLSAADPDPTGINCPGCLEEMKRR